MDYGKSNCCHYSFTGQPTATSRTHESKQDITNFNKIAIRKWIPDGKWTRTIIICVYSAVLSYLKMSFFKHAVALTFFRRYKRSDCCFCACAIYVKSEMTCEKTKHLWYKYYGLFVRMYIASQQSYLSQINTRQTGFEAYFDSKCKPRESSAP